MSPKPVVLAVSPHPDDELLGAGATLMALRDAGWRVINLAAGLGRREDWARRRAELEDACRRARFELVIADGLPPIGRDDDLQLAQRALASAIVAAAEKCEPQLLVGPSPHDGHHGHELVGRAILDAVQTRSVPARVMFWGLWGDLPFPNLVNGFDAARLAELQLALAAHAGELARGRFDRLLEGRAAAQAVLGPERVFQFGAPALQHDYAELLMDVAWSQADGWRLLSGREFDPARPLAGEDGQEIGWWLRAPSVHESLRLRRYGR